MLQKKLERFDELHEWGGYKDGFTRIEHGERDEQFYTLMPKIEKLPFGIRYLVTDIWTICLLVTQEFAGQFKIDRMAREKEDIELGIDVFLEDVAAGYKIRVGYLDIPCVRLQPCYGLGNPMTKDGRDYRGVRDGNTKHYYTAIWKAGLLKHIHRVDSDELFKMAKKIDDDWGMEEAVDCPFPPWESKKFPGVQVWHQKVERNFTKYNYYIPPKPEFFKSLKTVTLSSHGANSLNEFYRAAWDRVVNKYIHKIGVRP